MERRIGSDDEDPVIEGVPLAQYAAVTAALGEAHALKAVLAVEGLDAKTWAKADLGWTQRLAEDAALMARYEKAFAVAGDRLARTVEPIDADLGAWLAFLSALVHGSEILEQNGIGVDDVARLRRRWDARMRETPALRMRAAEIQRSGLGELPPLRIVKAKLTRSGAGLSAASRATSTAPEPSVPIASTPRMTESLGPSVAPSRRAKIAEDPSTLEAKVPSEIASPSRELLKPLLPFRSAAPSPEFLKAWESPAAAPGDGSDGETVDLATFANSSADECDDESTMIAPARLGAAPATALPFVSDPSPSSARPTSDDDREPSSTPFRDGETVLGTTSPLVQRVLPFVPDFSKQVAPGAGPAQPMSLERHACLCLEIAVDPAHADDALARYQVSPAEKTRLDELYRAEVEADPALRARWNRAFEDYRAWFTSRSRG